MTGDEHHRAPSVHNTMRLKQLELQGYKTFALRTEFIFDGGITAIVGPNGSGKSNIADAIRWVLGEQSYRSLRGKRTEDMIFSGSTQRARLGMASASLILDNRAGWLPIDFEEVTVTRRAYRSGENEYLVNGSRVRLRDITELLARSGLAERTYTVVGQGLVDAVLSLRSDDRRALFEEAAGISLYQSKRTETLSRLEETRSNLVRVNDIIHEIEPRLRRLEREAERAEHYHLLSQQLEGLLRTWHGFRWHQEQQNLHRARDAVTRRLTSLDQHHQALQAHESHLASLRARQARLRQQLSGWHGESSELHGQMEHVQRDLAVWQERDRLLARQREELQVELGQLEAQAQVAEHRVAEAEEELVAGQAALEAQGALVVEAQADLDAYECQREVISRQLAEAQALVLDLQTEAAKRANRLEQLGERGGTLEREHAIRVAAIATHQGRMDDLAHRLQALEFEHDGLTSDIEALSAEAARLDVDLTEAQASRSELHALLEDAQRDAERLCGRYELLTRLRVEGEGLEAGVRAVLQAAGGEQAGGDPRSPALSGILGTVTRLLDVPAEHELAVEVALASHLQDIVVESWSDAEAAISYLRKEKRGRATFLALDTVRPLPRLDLPEDRCLVGIVADLVRAEARLAPVVEMLLGRTILVRDLQSARRIFGRLRGSFQIVTPAGEVLHSGGSVTGGQRQTQAEGQLLARDREQRELPAQMAAADRHSEQIQKSLTESEAAEERVREQVTAIVSRRQMLEEALAVAREQRRDLEVEAGHVAQQITFFQELVARLDDEAGELEDQGSSLKADLQKLLARREEAESQVAAFQSELDRLHGEALYEELAEARTTAAVAREAWDHRCAALDSLRQMQAQLVAQMKAKCRRIAQLQEEEASLTVKVDAQKSQEVVIQGWLTSLAKRIEPAEEELARLDVEREALEAEERTLRVRLRQAESRHSQALLTRSRREDRLQRLRQQIMDDFGLVEIEPVQGVPEQPPLPLGELVSALPTVDRLPEGLEEEVHQVKAQLRRMGSINPNAPAEYAEALERHSFLSAQAADLDEAISDLRQVMAELDEVMRRDFQATFQEVATRFSENFTRLFGGGAARLVLTEPEDISRTGVDIVARPPGRRQQTLALLSGGERSLTAVALVFALLEVSAPPFCVLDEVDAMLDEVNVRRFREALEQLAERIQFIVITHNRRTIEAAATIYGVSMGDDSVSQVVSLRLEGDRIATPDGSAVQVLEDG